MRFKTTILLSVILILLGSYLYFFELPAQKVQEEAKRTEGKLFSFATHEITRVVIRGPKGEIDLEYFPGHPDSPWRIFNPVETEANQYAGTDLGTLLEGIRASRLVEENPTDLANFGLDPPVFSVIITLQKNDTEIIEIGNENLTRTDVYVRKGLGTSLYLVPASIKKVLNKDLRSWRRTEVFPYSSFDISMMRLISPQGILELSKDDDGWAMHVETIQSGKNKILSLRGNASEVANLLGSIVNLQGNTFIDRGKAEKKKKFAAPRLKITVKVGAVERTGTFYKDDVIPGLINVVTKPLDPIFQLHENELAAILQPFETYRDRRVVALTFPEEIERLEISRPNANFILNKKDGDWFVMGKETKILKETRQISRLLTYLYNLQITSFLDDLDKNGPDTAFDLPLLVLNLKAKDDRPLAKITFGKIEGEKIVVMSSWQPKPFTLKKEVLEQIPDEETFF